MSRNVHLELEEAVYEACYLLKAAENHEFDNDAEKWGFLHLSGQTRKKLMDAYAELMESGEAPAAK